MEAGWSVRKPSQNEQISNLDILHVFQKVDRDRNNLIDWQVAEGVRRMNQEVQTHSRSNLSCPGDEISMQVPLSAVWN